MNVSAMTPAQMQAYIAALQAENAGLKKAKAPAGDRMCTFKCSTFTDEMVKDQKSGQMVNGKGTVSAYGMGRRPITGYANQWAKILKTAAQLARFVIANADRLGFKDTASQTAGEQKADTVRFFKEAMPHLEALGKIALGQPSKGEDELPPLPEI